MFVPESVTDTELQFRLNVTTLSTELAPDDNVNTLTLTLRNKVTTNFKGFVKRILISV